MEKDRTQKLFTHLTKDERNTLNTLSKELNLNLSKTVGYAVGFTSRLITKKSK